MALLNEQKTWSVCYGLTAFAEWGITRNDVDIDKYVDWIIENTGFVIHCGEGMLISNNKKINDPKYPHKSCYRLTTTYLLLLAELKLHNISIPCEQQYERSCCIRI